ncbi:unnamed protein product [Effrenium voratum]|uniref:protein-disulfide reductase n=1 Tax=Effrenium voratum TaxID=2562239 RepID=A0AA36N689_9DINO|nr:unnamed protein product [Effrenium voratum]
MDVGGRGADWVPPLQAAEHRAGVLEPGEMERSHELRGAGRGSGTADGTQTRAHLVYGFREGAGKKAACFLKSGANAEPQDECPEMDSRVSRGEWWDAMEGENPESESEPTQSEDEDHRAEGDYSSDALRRMTEGPLGIFFSAKLLLPSQLSAELRANYQAYKASLKFEVLQVPADTRQEDFDREVAGVPWRVVPFRDEAARVELMQRFHVQSLPKLVLFYQDGTWDEGFQPLESLRLAAGKGREDSAPPQPSQSQPGRPDTALQAQEGAEQGSLGEPASSGVGPKGGGKGPAQPGPVPEGQGVQGLVDEADKGEAPKETAELEQGEPASSGVKGPKGKGPTGGKGPAQPGPVPEGQGVQGLVDEADKGEAPKETAELEQGEPASSGVKGPKGKGPTGGKGPQQPGPAPEGQGVQGATSSGVKGPKGPKGAGKAKAKAAGFAATPTRPEVKCKFKAKPLRWKRLLDQQLENSVFRNEDVPINEERLAEVFAISEDMPRRNTIAAIKVSPETEKVRAQLWVETENQAGRAKGMAILGALFHKQASDGEVLAEKFLRQLGVLDLEAIIEDSSFERDRFNQLVQQVSSITKEEKQRLLAEDAEKKYSWDIKVEGFYKRLVAMPFSMERLLGLQGHLRMTDELQDFSQKVRQLSRCVSAARGCQALSTLLLKLRSIGNLLNSGNESLGRADSFDVVSLLDTTADAYRGHGNISLLTYLKEIELSLDERRQLGELAKVLAECRRPEEAADPGDVQKLKHIAAQLLVHHREKLEMPWHSAMERRKSSEALQAASLDPELVKREMEALSRYEGILKGHKEGVEDLQEQLEQLGKDVQDLHRHLAYTPPETKELSAGLPLAVLAEVAKKLQPDTKRQMRSRAETRG